MQWLLTRVSVLISRLAHVCLLLAQAADAAADAAERQQQREAAGEDLPLVAEQQVGGGDADVPADAFAAVKAALAESAPGRGKGASRAGKLRGFSSWSLLLQLSMCEDLSPRMPSHPGCSPAR